MKGEVKRKPELLAPAGSLEKLYLAVDYGADAVYLGGAEFSLRAGAENFTPEEMQQGVEYAHQRGVKVYAAVNIFARNQDLGGLPAYLRQLAEIEVDALIVSDPGVIELAREAAPRLPLHLSTQANSLNWASVRFWERQGVSRVVLARELSLAEIREIRSRVGLELEIFVHGAMCISYSGRCYLSQYLSGREANRGECTQPCRWRYALVEEKRPGQFLPVEEDGRGAYILSSRDLCLLEHIPQLVEAGLDSLKIEGRMKSLHYVATVVRAYRLALDTYLADPAGYTLDPHLLEEVVKVSHRPYTDSIFVGGGGAEREDTAPRTGYLRTCEFVALVLDYDRERGIARIEQRSPFGLGDEIEIVGPRAAPFRQRVTALYDESGRLVDKAPHPQQRLYLPTERPVEAKYLVRRITGAGKGIGPD
ncbi:MAG: U32 family peptidase [Syntrophomonadaceae bacterium]|nr:U32 family peptidase [Syntrophomonadaceae bacterium]